MYPSEIQNSWWERKHMLIWFWFYKWFDLHHYSWADTPDGICVQRGKSSWEIFWDNVACSRADSERKQWWLPVFKRMEFRMLQWSSRFLVMYLIIRTSFMHMYHSTYGIMSYIIIQLVPGPCFMIARFCSKFPYRLIIFNFRTTFTFIYEQYCSNLLGSCKCGNELSCSIKCKEFFD